MDRTRGEGEDPISDQLRSACNPEYFLVLLSFYSIGQRILRRSLTHKERTERVFLAVSRQGEEIGFSPVCVRSFSCCSVFL